MEHAVLQNLTKGQYKQVSHPDGREDGLQRLKGESCVHVR